MVARLDNKTYLPTKINHRAGSDYMGLSVYTPNKDTQPTENEQVIQPATVDGGTIDDDIPF